MGSVNVLYVEISPSDYHVLHPHPAYLIVSRSIDGVLNVIAASGVMPVSEKPLYIVLSLIVRPGLIEILLRHVNSLLILLVLNMLI
jgi:flavin reductase (DIM6/NTAB) family NADH-FMN oxidoreductase RutF